MGKGLNASIFSVIYGPLWFLFMLICLYLIIPFLRKFLDDDRLIIYFLGLNITVTFIIPLLSTAIGNFSVPAKKAVDIVVENSFFYFASGYTGYFILGYWLTKTQITKKYKILMGILGISAFVTLPIMTRLESMKLGIVHDCYGNLTLGILFESIFIFSMVKDRFNNLDSKMNKFFQFAGSHTLGIYLVHKIILDLFNDVFGIRWNFINVVLSIPLLTVCVFILSGLASIILSKIPIIKKILL